MPPMPPMLGYTVFGTLDYPDLPTKIEGVAIVDGSQLVLINDDDFGIEGAKTRIVRLSMPAPAF